MHVIRRYLLPTDNWVDVGAHKGLILDTLLRQAPRGKGFAFEPLPHLYKKLLTKYRNRVSLHDCALSDTIGEADFFFNVNRPAVSGFRQRIFDESPEVQILQVKVDTLDNAISDAIPIRLIKIDVEGAELCVLKGAERILKTNRPIVLFEFGLGAADLYDANPGEVYDFLQSCGLSLSTLELFLYQKQPLSREEFKHSYNKGYDYFFIAYNTAIFAENVIRKIL